MKFVRNVNHHKVEQLSLTVEKFPETFRVLHQALGEKITPGFALGVWRAKTPHQFLIGSLGKSRLLPSENLTTDDTIYDLASLTKVLATSSLAMQAVQRGWLRWEDPVVQFLPDFPYRDTRIFHLLSHTSGLPSWCPFHEQLRKFFGKSEDLYLVPVAQRLKKVRELALSVQREAKPGEQWKYSDVGYILMYFILEEIFQLPFDLALESMVWSPMHLHGLYFREVNRAVKWSRTKNVAATEDCPWRKGILQGQVHDDNCWAMGGVSGHAGVFGRVYDVLFFVRQIFGGFFDPKVLQESWAPVSGAEHTVGGWMVPSSSGRRSCGDLFSSQSVGHLGFTGCSLWIDLDAELAVTLLSNRVHPKRDEKNAEDFRRFRPKFHDAIREDLKNI